MICPACGKENRPQARYCRFCGTPGLDRAGDAGTTDASPLRTGFGRPSGAEGPQEPGTDHRDDPAAEEIIGLPELTAALRELEEVLEAIAAGPSRVRLNHNTIVVGNSGTGKSLVTKHLCGILARHGVTIAPPLLVNAPDLERMDGAGFGALFKSARGGALVIDNAQTLVQGGENASGITRLLGEMDRHPGDPVVVLSGLPFGLREFLRKDANKHVTGRFKNIFYLPDYDTAALTEIASRMLASQGLSLAPGARERLAKRFTYLVKESKKTDSEIESRNGHMARNTVQDMVQSYFLRRGEDRTILPEDIRGEIEEEKTLDEAMEELESFVGMEEIKRTIRSLAGRLRVRLEREGPGGSGIPFHVVLTGNPGTGKTSVTRVLGEVLRALGLLETGHVVEVDRSRLVGRYVGQTAPLVNEVCDRAMGGVLFIDEAYALARGEDDGKDFGREAIETLLKRMEDDRGKFVVVAAGYTREMEAFLASNPGLRSRFTHRFELPDYTPDELFAIFRLIAKRHGYRLIESAAETKLLRLFTAMVLRKTRTFANGREARTVFEEVERRHADRLSRELAEREPAHSETAHHKHTSSRSRRRKTGEREPAHSEIDSGGDEELSIIRAEDIPGGTEGAPEALAKAMAGLDSLIGLERVKTKVREITDTIEVQRLRGQDKPLALHFVFTGNPGTGKTTVARHLAGILSALGVLPTATLVETDRSGLVARYAGQTAPLVNEVCDRAMGGVLFIDEAYALSSGRDDQFGREAIETLLKRMEDDRGKFVVVAAGYTREMEAFLASNPGLRSRFTDFIRFDDFTADECRRIFKRFAAEEGYKLTRGLSNALEKLFAEVYLKRSASARTGAFSNARAVRDLFEKARARQSSRIRKYREAGMTESALQGEADILRVEDLPIWGEAV